MRYTRRVDELPDDHATLWFLIRRVAGLMDRTGESLFRSRLGISLAQFLVLSVIDAYPGDLSQQAIADRLGLTKGTVSKQLDGAITAGLVSVSPSPTSRRENRISLTEAGTALVRRGDAAFDEARAVAQPDIPPADLRTTIATLAALNEALERA